MCHVTLQAQQLSDGSSSPHVDAVVAKIMHVFADALPHVPAHRRLPVLAQLVTMLGPAHYLWVLMLLLFKLHATQAASSASDKVGKQIHILYTTNFLSHVSMCMCVCVQEVALQTDVDLWISVCCHFEVSEQLVSLVNILNFLLQLPDDKDDNGESHDDRSGISSHQ